jgi:hypothetical protein
MSPGNSNNFGYPPAHSQQQSSIQLPSGYPSSNYPSSNNASGYPAPGNSFYQQQQQPGMPTGYNDSNNNNSSYGYPQAGSPSLPGNRPGQPQQDQYGYPTYPQ